MNVSEYLATFLKEKHVETVFGYQGGNISRIIDALDQYAIEYIQTFHEQAAAFAACSYAQINNTFGVAVSSSGPGAMNMITGIANAYYDSIPCLFITGNVNKHNLLNRCVHVRQQAFQESNIVDMVHDITKYAKTVLNGENFIEELNKAIILATTGRKGPVLLDIPHDVQWEEANPTEKQYFVSGSNADFSSITKQQIIHDLTHATKPLILIGGGMQEPNCIEKFKSFLCQFSIPVVASLRALDILPYNHPCFMGMIGDYGHEQANIALIESDFLFVLGSRMDERQIKNQIKERVSQKNMVRIDIDQNELSFQYQNGQHICLDLTVFLTWLTTVDINCDQDILTKWNQQCMIQKKHYQNQNKNQKYSIHGALVALSEAMQPHTIICVDVGIHQMYAANTIKLKPKQRFLISGGLGSMGYALPASIGAYYAQNDRPIVCISGDGGIQMNIQELQIISSKKLPIKIVIVNNHQLGMIADYQKIALNHRLIGSVEGYVPADFKALALAYKLNYFCVKSKQDYDQLPEIMNTQKSYIIELDFIKNET